MLIPSIRVDGQQAERVEATPAVQWMDWQQRARSFDALAAYVSTFGFLIDSGGSESIRTMHNLANVQTGYSTDRILTPFDQRRAARVVQGFGGGEPIAVVQARD